METCYSISLTLAYITAPASFSDSVCHHARLQVHPGAVDSLQRHLWARKAVAGAEVQGAAVLHPDGGGAAGRGVQG